MNKTGYSLLAKNNLLVAQLLGLVVLLAQMYNPPTKVLVGILAILTVAFSTVSTYAWMSR